MISMGAIAVLLRLMAVPHVCPAIAKEFSGDATGEEWWRRPVITKVSVAVN
jgi:hypothetical protein